MNRGSLNSSLTVISLGLLILGAEACDNQGKATCTCGADSGYFLPSLDSLAGSVGDQVVDAIVGASCDLCWSISDTLINGLWPSGGTNIWDQIKAKVQSMIDNSLYDAQMKDLSSKLDSFKIALGTYNELADKDSSQGRTSIDSLLIEVESNLCTFVSPTTVQNDVSNSIRNGQYVFLAPFMDLHLSILLERNKVYKVSKQNEENDASNKATFLGAVNAWNTLMSSSYTNAVDFRMGKISKLSAGKKWHGNEENEKKGYTFTDSYSGDLTCTTVEGSSGCTGNINFPSCYDYCWSDAESIGQACYNTYVSDHKSNVDSAWTAALTTPVQEWTANAATLADKIHSAPVTASYYDWTTACNSLSNAQASIMV